jgi:response regulator RpfG family c-di-GMP phosphodiesterase
MNTEKPISVLVAEKAPDARQLIREAILTIDQRALIIDANDGPKAEFKIANQVFDLIITATKLPGKDGLQLLTSFKEMDKKKRPRAVILLTDGKFDEKWNELFSPLHHIEKPFEMPALKALLSTVFQGLKKVP